ncbi:MAG: hypothetical protein JOS17DRAFT_269579 [Linnemannia elongata]|nr:MAG: hypothetical protein JOS17DRAFT_269579 [Linnemannia elongata]
MIQSRVEHSFDGFQTWIFIFLVGLAHFTLFFLTWSMRSLVFFLHFTSNGKHSDRGKDKKSIHLFFLTLSNSRASLFFPFRFFFIQEDPNSNIRNNFRTFPTIGAIITRAEEVGQLKNDEKDVPFSATNTKGKKYILFFLGSCGQVLEMMFPQLFSTFGHTKRTTQNGLTPFCQTVTKRVVSLYVPPLEHQR